MKKDLRQLSQEEFPPLLREIPDPPKKLYLRGALPSSSFKLLTVVGSRKYTPYGKAVVEKLISGLRGFPVAIVSGLALGIDALAHEAALAAKLPTIALPGSGLNPDVLYPRAHYRLAERILEARLPDGQQGGALLSEFEPDFRARPESFLQRNRVMAAVAEATLIIEAASRSGTLVTAKLAVDYNRELLVVPGSIFSPNSFGPHLFLSLGATPVTSSEDILKALHIEPAPKPIAERTDLSEAERRVLRALVEPRTRDELLASLALPASEANILLSTMELKGLIAARLGTIERA
ncbi:DNA protecting protein DprA [Candidatus Kaiserbacteria bacterium RIFCSPLOWO2_01_FULL_51_21]|uniref:DNA protecting protein DprA n=1 Tax=Candidatus Kaiserbacteria bacterium RIFCSPLOWO2_01_FULL_51_21 TaxID=1798508 RepID=A0A1F6ED43_9BACT|nr:MAG: DNA protecting protein DprA [Candidatus Kaiserbacteria bacterium RIFCSPLOWO2_01_FULL_51_21]